jgi:hypothetical protein
MNLKEEIGRIQNQQTSPETILKQWRNKFKFVDSDLIEVDLKSIKHLAILSIMIKNFEFIHDLFKEDVVEECSFLTEQFDEEVSIYPEFDLHSISLEDLDENGDWELTFNAVEDAVIHVDMNELKFVGTMVSH